ncbi:hypothetical protein C8R43DRAFT_943840 [Mycena crocata]|nr:hypothetical protein C8R43DRAFT_943840 [Mycena crocata]
MSSYNPRTGRVGISVPDAPMTVEALITEAHHPRLPRSRAFSEDLTPNRRRRSSFTAHPPPPPNYDHLYQQIVYGNAMRRTLHPLPEPKVFVDRETPDEGIRDMFRRKSYPAPGTPRQFDDGYSNEPLF